MWRTSFMACVGGIVIAGGALSYFGHTKVDKAQQVADAREALKSDDIEQAKAAAETLSQLGSDAKPATDDLIKTLQSKDVGLRVASARALGAIGPEARAAIPILIEQLHDEEAVEGGQAWMYVSQSLGKLGKDAVAPLVASLNRDNTTQYRGVCSALHEIGSDAAEAVPALITIVETNDDNIIPALFALQGIGPASKDAVPALIKALENDDFHTQYWSCRVLAAIGPEAREAAPHLATALRDGITSVRRNAATALGEIGPSEEAIQVLTEALDDPLQFVRDDAVIALGKYGGQAEAAVPKIKSILEGASLAPRARAAGALYRIDPSHEDLVFRVLMEEIQRDSAPWDAAKELGLLAPDAGRVDEVLKLLESERDATREYGSEAAGWMGRHAKAALPRLKKIVGDSDQHNDIRDSARAAIFRIEEDIKEAETSSGR